MDSLKKWLVALDLTDHDKSILKYTKLLSDVLHPDHIEFVFISHRLADAVHIHLPQKFRYPAYDDLFEKLNREVNEYFTEEDPVSCEVTDGPVQFDLWKETYVKDIDLFIAGSKPRHQGMGLFPRKFVRKSFCSVLLVPEVNTEKISKIWVPVDFSEQSGEALNLALRMSQEIEPNAEVCAHHVYQLPHGYYYEDFPRDEIINAVRLAANDEFDVFAQKYNSNHIPLSSSFTELIKPYAANSIKHEAEAAEVDLIMMAGGGRSRFSNLFLGSETEELVQLKTKVPLLILKKKSEHVKLWDLYAVCTKQYSI